MKKKKSRGYRSVGCALQSRRLEARHTTGGTAVEKKVSIVVRSHGLPQVKAFLLGSVSDKVSHHDKCPTLIVR